MQRALENAIGELCLGPEIANDPASIRAWLQRHELDEDDIEFLLEGDRERLLVYRRLVRANLYGALEVSIPRTMARMGETFDAYFAAFLAERGPRTHYLRDVVDEFLEFVRPRWQPGAEVPMYLWDLARHEALRIQIGAMRSGEPGDVTPELDLQRGVRFIEAARIIHYDHAVHELSENESDRTQPERRSVALLVYRSPDHDVRFLELTPMAAQLLENLMDRGETLESALVHAADSAGYSLPGAAIEGTARLLADLAQRGVLLGAA